MCYSGQPLAQRSTPNPFTQSLQQSDPIHRRGGLREAGRLFSRGTQRLSPPASPRQDRQGPNGAYL